MTEDEVPQLGEELMDCPSQLKGILKGMERRRHLMVWGDNSTLLNHSHLLLTASAIYDEALYHTNDEMKAKGKDNIDMQSLVERPQCIYWGGVDPQRSNSLPTSIPERPVCKTCV